MKRLIAVTMAAGLALSASADILEQWQYNETTAGLRIDQSANTGTVGTSWNWGDPTKWATDGNGYLDLAPTTGTDYKTSQAFPALASSELYSMEIKLGAWDIPVAAAAATVKWRLKNDTGGTEMEIQTVMGTAGLSFTLVSDGTNYRNISAGGLTGSGATARIDFNVAAGTAAYFVNGVAGETFSGLDFGNLTSFGMNKEGTWTDAGRVMKIDEQSLSVVPEPATMGLVAMAGAALLGVRRYFNN